MRRRYQHGIIAAPGTTGEYLLSWLDGLRRSKQVRPNTLRGYESHVRRHFVPAFGSVPLERLRLSHVAAAFDRIDKANAEIVAARESDDPAVRKSVAGKRPAARARRRVGGRTPGSPTGSNVSTRPAANWRARATRSVSAAASLCTGEPRCARRR
jgi:hypothetical protein